LVNNAGIAGDRVGPAETTAEHVRAVYETNLLGVVRVTHAMLPLLRASASPVIVNVSSTLGSFAAVTNPELLESKIALVAYTSSKAALNMVTLQYAKALPEMRVNAVNPGYTATDLNQHRGTQTVEQGTAAIVRLATIGRDGPTGTFQDAGGVIEW
jgi:NAD(P)-dependent dehydrogenase (short-subunit alcohol dehydrogenase family)